MSLKEVDEGSTESKIRRRQEREEKRLAEEASKKISEEAAARKAKEEADRKAAEEAARKAKEEADRKAAEEAARKAKEEADRKAAEEADRKAKEEADRKAAEEADRKAKEEADRKTTEKKELTELLKLVEEKKLIAEELANTLKEAQLQSTNEEIIAITAEMKEAAVETKIETINSNLEWLYNAANGGLDWAYNHYHVVLLPTATYITANLVVNGLVNLKSMAELRATQWNLANKPEAPVTKVVETVEKRASVSLVKGMAGAINKDGIGASAIVRKEFIEHLPKIIDIAGTSKTFLPLKNMKVGEEQKVTEIITPLTDKTWIGMLWEVALEALSKPDITLSSALYSAVKPQNYLVAGVEGAIVAATVGYLLNKEECDNYIYDSLNNAYTAIEGIIPHWGEHN